MVFAEAISADREDMHIPLISSFHVNARDDTTI